MNVNDFEVEFSLKIYRLMMLSFILHAEHLSFQIYKKLMFNIDYVKPNIYFLKNGLRTDSCKYIICIIRVLFIIGGKRY